MCRSKMDIDNNSNHVLCPLCNTQTGSLRSTVSKLLCTTNITRAATDSYLNYLFNNS